MTLSEVILPATLGRARLPLLRLATLIIVFCFVFYIAAQFDGAGKAFTANFGWSSTNSILIGAAIIIAYTWLGGFWAVSVTDALQALMMLLVAVGLPLLAVIAAVAEPDALAALNDTAVGDVYPGVVGLAFVVGTLGIGLGYPGQPHVVNRFMALKDAQALRRGRAIALSWAVLVYIGMLSLGWSARVLIGTADAGEQALFLTADALLPPLAAGLVLAAVLSAIMSTADSQLLSAAAAVAHDWRLDASQSDDSPMRIRIVVLLIALTAVALALFVPQDIFSRVLFAWHAIGSALGPLLIARLLGWQSGATTTLLSILSGFALTVVFHLGVDSTGDWVERIVPFAVATTCIVIGGNRDADAGR